MTANNFTDIEAVILAGGMGTRLRSIVADKPKVLAEVNGRPFLDYLLTQVHSFGIRSVVLCTGYMGEKVEAVYGSRHLTLRLAYSREHEPLGTGGALSHAAQLIRTDQVLVLNGDSFCNLDFEAFCMFHTAKKAKISLTLAEVLDISRYGAVQTNIHGLIEKFEEKGKYSGKGLINAGIYLMDKTVINSIPVNRPVSLENEIFPQYVGSGFFGFYAGQNFIDIGIPSDYEAAQKLNFGCPL